MNNKNFNNGTANVLGNLKTNIECPYKAFLKDGLCSKCPGHYGEQIKCDGFCSFNKIMDKPIAAPANLLCGITAGKANMIFLDDDLINSLKAGEIIYVGNIAITFGAYPETPKKKGLVKNENTENVAKEEEKKEVVTFLNEAEAKEELEKVNDEILEELTKPDEKPQEDVPADDGFETVDMSNVEPISMDELERICSDDSTLTDYLPDIVRDGDITRSSKNDIGRRISRGGIRFEVYNPIDRAVVNKRRIGFVLDGTEA